MKQAKNKKRFKKDLLKDWHWPYLRHSGANAEYSCPHGIGHSLTGIHGCDGCCGHEFFRWQVENR